jgi:S1-C subfamily serine protease
VINKNMGEKNIPNNKTRSKSALLSLSEEIESVADKVSQSVVSVHSMTRGNGSGVVWSSDGLKVTCSHIVRNLDELQVSLSNGKSFPAKVIGNDPYSDIALLKIQANGKNESISLNPIEIDDSVLRREFESSITEGIITSESSSLGGSQWGAITDNIVITDARLNPGYSGGPLVDVEGLNAAYVSSRGIAIRASKARNISEHLAKDGAIKIAYLGIVTDEISLPSEVGAQLEPSQEENLIILSVEKTLLQRMRDS